MSTPEESAARRDGLIVLADVRAGGMSRRQIDHRLESGRWRLVRRGVAVVVGAPPTWRQGLRAVLVAAGSDAAASHSSAQHLFGVGDAVDRYEVSAPLARQVRLEGVIGHRSGLWEPGDVVTRWGLPCTSPARTVIDLSGRLDVPRLGRLVDELLRRRLLTLPELRRRAEAFRSAPGRSMRTVRLVLAQRPGSYDPGESELEARVMRLILRHGFPEPKPQHWVRRPGYKARLDHAYPEQRIYLEGDGFGHHFTASDLDSDARRRNRLVLDGWRPLSFTWRMTDAEIVATLDQIYDRATRRWRAFVR
jgi:hypothetical protein